MSVSEDELDPLRERPELDFSKGVRGKYAKMAQNGSNLVIIDIDLLDTFPDGESVNKALRELKQAGQNHAPVA